MLVFLLFHRMQDIIKSCALEREREREREHPISNGLSFFFCFFFFIKLVFHKTLNCFKYGNYSMLISDFYRIKKQTFD